MRPYLLYLSLTAVAFLLVGNLQAATSTSSGSKIQKNYKRLLKTKSCPSCDLTGVDLTRANLKNANLEGANLTDAKLFLADLSGANLKNSNLQGANLGGADLTTADLNGANLSGTVLEGAFFNATKMKGRVVNRLIHADEVQQAERDGKTSSTAVDAPSQSTQEPPEAIVDGQSGQAGNAHSKKIIAISDAIFGIAPVPSNDTASAARENSAEKGQSLTESTAAVNGDAPATAEPAEGEAASVTDASSEAVAVEETVTETKGQGEPEPSPTDEAAVVEAPMRAAVDEITQQEPPATSKTAKQEMIEQMFDRERCVGCDLSHIDLSGRDLEDFDLERVDLSNSDLRDADLSGANLKGANFRNAHLQNADLRKADLYRADFSGADLTGARLDDALLDSADFSGAIGLKAEEGDANK